jgi:hypothetical protein
LLVYDKPSIIAHMTNTFFRDKHNKQKFTAPVSGINSVFEEQIVSSVSAYISANGTAIIQPGRSPGRLARVPGFSAEMIPPGSLTATGYSSDFFIARAGTPSAHLMAYPEETVQERFKSSAWIPTGSP